MNKIQKFSRFFRILFQCFFILQPIGLIVFWSNASFWRTIAPSGSGYFIPNNIQILHTLTTSDAFYGFLVSILPTAANMLIFFFLIKLFKRYEQNEFFTSTCVKNIRNTGIAIIINQVIGMLAAGLMEFVLTIHNPVGHRTASLSFSNYDFNNIITAIMIILISWIMNEAAKLQEEQKYTV